MKKIEIATAVIGLLMDAAGSWQGWPRWVRIVCLVITALALISILFSKEDQQPISPEPRESVTIRGNADGTIMKNVNSNANVLVDGDARNAVLTDVVHLGEKQ